MRPIIAAFALLALAACSPGERHDTAEHAKAAATDLKDTVHQGADSPAGAELKADVKDLAKDAGQAIKAGAEDTKDALNSTVAKQQTPAKK